MLCICIPMVKAALYTIVEIWKQPNCPWKDDWVNKICHIHAMEYYLAFNRKKILTHAITWMNLEDTVLSHHKDVWFHLNAVPRAIKFVDRSRRVVVWGCGEGGIGDCCLMSTEFLFFKINGVLEIHCKMMWTYLTQLNCPLKSD